MIRRRGSRGTPGSRSGSSRRPKPSDRRSIERTKRSPWTAPNCHCGEWATTKLLDCSFVVRLIGYGLARKDLRIKTSSGRKCPTSSMEGGVLALLLSSPGAQSSEGSLEVFKQYVLLILNLSESNPLLCGGFPFYNPRWGPPVYIYLSRCLGSARGVLHLRQSVGPGRSIGSGEAGVRSVFLCDGLSSCCPVSGQSEWFRHSVGRSEVISYPIRSYQLFHP